MSTILIGTFVVALFILPFFLMEISKNKGKKHLKEALNKIAEDNKCNITQSEFWTDSAIGLDENTNHLFFVHTFNGKETIQHLLLQDYRNCKVNNISRNIKDRQGDHKAIDRIELEFSPIDKSKPETFLEFFNSEGNKFHTDELMVSEKWSGIVRKRIVNHGKK
jgi:hypothetical protein